MSDPAPTIWPHDDIDAFEAAAWSATWRWMRTIEPLQPVQFGFIGRRYEALGRELTRNVDADELARRAAKRKARAGSDKLGPALARLAESILKDYRNALIAAGAVPDDLASGW